MEKVEKKEESFHYAEIVVHSPLSPDRKISVNENIESIKEEDEPIETKQPDNDHLKVPEKEDSIARKSGQHFLLSEKFEKEEIPKILNNFTCILPSAIPLLYVAHKTCFVLHFNKTDEVMKILNFEKMSKVFSMAVKPKKSSFRKSKKDLMFGQHKEKKDGVI